MTVSRATPTDFLLPFLRLPALRICVGMTTEDGATVYSEDLGARQLTIAGAPTFGSTDRGIPFIWLNGSTDYLSVADASWNSPSGMITAFCVHKPDDTATASQAMISKWKTGGNTSWIVRKTTAIRFEVSNDGSTSFAITNTAPAASWQLTVGQFEPSTAVRVWNSLAGTPLATNSTSIPASMFNSSGALMIGAFPNSLDVASNFYDGQIAVAGFCAAKVDATYITSLIDHCRKFGVA